MILIITNKEDVHPSPVIDLLTARGVPFFRLNTEALLTDYIFDWQANADECDFRIECPLNGLTVRGSEITAIWERRPELPEQLSVTNTPEIDKHNREEATGFLQFLRFFLKDIPSIGSIVYDRVASSKMLQLKIAREIGFPIPPTCFSNRKEDIVRFADGREWLTLKSIENASIWDEENDREYVFYAQKVAVQALTDIPEQAFSQTVSFVQEYIDKAFELRITVVGEQVFACKIDSQRQSSNTGKIDWRQGYDYGLKQEAFELPEEVATKCRTFLKRMHLNFGCFDLIVTPGGEYVFLECNPNGQWLWVELATGLPIAAAVADFLQLKCNPAAR